MGIIDIDDRDVFNYYYHAQADPKTLQTYLNSLKSENKTANVVNLGESRFKLDLPAIVCTGADVITLFQIPFMHVFEKMEIKHVDSANVDSVTLLNYNMSHRHHPNLWMILLNVIDSTASDIIDEYISYYMDRGNYKLITNSTNTELLYISVYIKVTGN